MSEARPGLATEPVPDGSLASSAARPARAEPRAEPVSGFGDTQYVADLPRFGRFQAMAELGAGAMGTVYRAHDDVLGRAVAIKTLQAHGDVELRERFLREARAIGAVHHPHILAIYNAGTEGDMPYLVMELAAGGSLRDRLRAGPLPLDTVRLIGIQIARALAAAHAANILHRDVKPANILCAHDGMWKLADFGIARLPDSTLTVTGQFLGTPSYAAPESLRAGEFSPASDIYGLGATLYEALTGAPPYGAHDMQSLVRKLEQDPPPLRGPVAIPAPLGDAIMATLARDPAGRPSAERLAQLLASSGVPETSAPPASTPPVRVAPAPATWSRRRKLAIAGLVAALVLLVLAMKYRSQTSSQTPAQALPLALPEAGDESAADPSGASGDPGADPEDIESADQPTVVDENGDPVDEETARRVLEQIEREYQGKPWRRGRGRHKQKYGGH